MCFFAEAKVELVGESRQKLKVEAGNLEVKVENNFKSALLSPPFHNYLDFLNKISFSSKFTTLSPSDEQEKAPLSLSLSSFRHAFTHPSHFC